MNKNLLTEKSNIITKVQSNLILYFEDDNSHFNFQADAIINQLSTMEVSEIVGLIAEIKALNKKYPVIWGYIEHYEQDFSLITEKYSINKKISNRTLRESFENFD